MKDRFIHNTFNGESIVDKDWFLDAFADEVNSGVYQKLPYYTWKQLVKSKCSHFCICILDTDIAIMEAFVQTNNSHQYFSLGNCLYRNENCEFQEGFEKFILDYWRDYEPEWIKEKTMQELMSKTPLNNIEENKNMKTNNLFNFDFGPVLDNQFRLSPYGLAVNTKDNGWISYNKQTEEIFNVEIINFDASKLIYRIPVALSEIAVGDILIHASKPVFVKSINKEAKTVSVINYADATVVDIVPIKSPFGFNFFTKVQALIDFNNENANADNPFGNLLPFLMLENNKEFDPMLFLFMNKNNDFSKNPLMLYFLMNENKGSNILPFLFMNNNLFGTNNFTTTPELPAITN